MIVIGKVVAGLALAAGGIGTSVAVLNTVGSPERDQGVVERVVDGDTVDVSVGGTITRIRLLNIDTPETVDPDQPVQCLGPEATEFLKSVLPAGTAVGLEYDEERIDQYDRTLAGVFTADGKLVNAEIARQGLAEAVIVGDNDRFYPPVEQARDEAMSAGRGLYDRHRPGCRRSGERHGSGRDRGDGGRRSGNGHRAPAGVRRRPARGRVERSASDGARALDRCGRDRT